MSKDININDLIKLFDSIVTSSTDNLCKFNIQVSYKDDFDPISFEMDFINPSVFDISLTTPISTYITEVITIIPSSHPIETVVLDLIAASVYTIEYSRYFYGTKNIDTCDIMDKFYKMSYEYGFDSRYNIEVGIKSPEFVNSVDHIVSMIQNYGATEILKIYNNYINRNID